MKIDDLNVGDITYCVEYTRGDNLEIRSYVFLMSMEINKNGIIVDYSIVLWDIGAERLDGKRLLKDLNNNGFAKTKSAAISNYIVLAKNGIEKYKEKMEDYINKANNLLEGDK